MRNTRRSRRPLGRDPEADRSARLYVTLPPSDIARFRFLLEAHDNLALFTVLDKHRAALRLSFPVGLEPQVRAALARMADEIALTVIEPRLG
ncbi:hypothetical protein dsx2_1588 [Desulfovibrio sp. X2]|uniref:DUF4911 domain-containing protein n=1 Tax=Desulfovibrio sp. X2 TaxID=941449 RepID=UPI000358DDC5|nr:DUF4911 domain-containing protein [Desulfovibrio sp. X2]EPR44227.1 hypothetical protein dsx2_1588 [Desulfovibrio sp. X2]